MTRISFFFDLNDLVVVIYLKSFGAVAVLLSVLESIYCLAGSDHA
jgi:hypothetical protein